MTDQHSRAGVPNVRVDRQGDVAHVVLANGPGGNALDLDTACALRDAIAAVTADPAVRAIVLRGEGERFCVGGDLRAFERAPIGANATCSMRAMTSLSRRPRLLKTKCRNMADSSNPRWKSTADKASAVTSLRVMPNAGYRAAPSRQDVVRIHESPDPTW